MTPKLIGKTLLNQFRVDAFLASGGMGAVYRVWDLKRNVPLAMKVLHSNLGEDPSVFKSFQREAISLKKLAHPNIVPFYGLHQVGENAFLLQRFIDGPTLKELLQENKGRPLAISDALVYLKAVAAALHFAHASTVVHCDVKPGNVLLDRGGNIYLTDFGIARHADSTTTTMVGLGTPAYMAPEQILEKSVTPATDIYALGVMLFEMVTGQRPFKGTERDTESGGQTVNERIRYAHLHLLPPDPRSLNPQIPEALGQAILKALEKDPKRRYASTQEFFEAVCRALGWNPANVADRVKVQGWDTAGYAPAEGAGQPAHGDSVPSVGRPEGMGTQVGRNKGLVAVLVGGLALVIVGAMIAFSGNGSGVGTPNPNLQGSSGSGLDQQSQDNPAEAVELPVYLENDKAVQETQIEQAIRDTQAAQAIQYTQIAQAIESTQAAQNATQAGIVQADQDTRATLSSRETQSAAAAQAALSPTQVPLSSLRIAYARGPVGNSDIYIADADGRQETTIATRSCDEAEPAWSPDGRNIVYQSDCNGSYDIWVSDVLNRNQYAINPTNDKDQREPDVSPDGTQIVYRENPKGTNRNSNGEIWAMNWNGSGAQYLGFVGRSPTWSPDGSQIAYMSDVSGIWQIYVHDLASRTSTMITECSVNCRWPSWSPDGRYVVYNITTGKTTTDPDGIWYSPKEGGAPRQVIKNRGAGRPCWSATGWVVYNTAAGIDISQADGSQSKTIIHVTTAWAPACSN